ncbi:MAG: hypothetical protein HAW67_06515 [Endozoicomonadaceae bacterium]|nr:hypothetical protein [Endozoicomonadaceae bacterium]
MRVELSNEWFINFFTDATTEQVTDFVVNHDCFPLTDSENIDLYDLVDDIAEVLSDRETEITRILCEQGRSLGGMYGCELVLQSINKGNLELAEFLINHSQSLKKFEENFAMPYICTLVNAGEVVTFLARNGYNFTGSEISTIAECLSLDTLKLAYSKRRVADEKNIMVDRTFFSQNAVNVEWLKSIGYELSFHRFNDFILANDKPQYLQFGLDHFEFTDEQLLKILATTLPGKPKICQHLLTSHPHLLNRIDEIPLGRDEVSELIRANKLSHELLDSMNLLSNTVSNEQDGEKLLTNSESATGVVNCL